MGIDGTEATNSLSAMASNSAIFKNPDREKLMHDFISHSSDPRSVFDVSSPAIFDIFNRCLKSGCFPAFFKAENIVSIPKCS